MQEGSLIHEICVSSQSLQEEESMSTFPPKGLSVSEYNFSDIPVMSLAVTFNATACATREVMLNLSKVARGSCPSTLRRFLVP